MTSIYPITTDPRLPITQEWLDLVCRPGQGAACCRYLGRSTTGWGCLKLDADLRAQIDERAHTIGAKGDNCTGRTKDGGPQ